MRALGRAAIFVGALVLTVLLVAAAFGFAATWGLLRMLGRDVVLNADKVRFWPDSWPTVALYAWGAPLHLAMALAILFLLLPLSLALLERAYLALDARPQPPSEEE